MWIEKGDIVTAIRDGETVSGRVIKTMINCPRCIVRFLDPNGGYKFISEQWHYDDLRQATDEEIKQFADSTSTAQRKDAVSKWGKNAEAVKIGRV
jgi:hypothetical protein